MKKQVFIFLVMATVFFVQPVTSQKVYPISCWESLFQWSDVELPVYSTNPRLRYTFFFNMGQYWHADLTNNVGLFSGLAVRNVGFIYDTDIPTKTIRRSYNLGVPLAIKLGVFDKHLYLFGGGEYELLFHYKGKRWDSNDRDGTKYKDTGWFSSKTERFVPSWFVGVQFPGGFNLKYKQYIGDFLNLDYVGNDLGNPIVHFSDFTKLTVHYISLSWQIRTDKVKDFMPTDRVAYNH